MASENDPLAALAAAQAAFEKSRAAGTAASSQQWTQPWNAEIIQFLVVGLLAFAATTLILSAVLMWRSNATPHQILRIFGILSIISISALLLIVGYSNEQLTPIVGLFGAIAGYLLGKESNIDKS